ncbi:MAG: hypothetical protein IJF06_00930 [Bacteroidaceae bacterium]|nr:hypothetical protein [Bacteroidaceae bacterium]
MKKILAHSKSDAQKRRDEFEEHYKTYSGHGYDLDKIKKTVNKELDLKFLRYYHGESAKFSNEPNPIFSFCDGRMQFTEQGLCAALKKKGGNPELLKMEIAEIPSETAEYNTSLYFKRKDVMTQICTITYDCIQMEIRRTYVKGSPYSHYTIIPAKEIPWRTTSGYYYIHTLELTEQEFYFLDLATLLMDLALEYSLRQEEIAYHAKQMRILAMETTVLDEENIPLEPIDDTAIESSIAECSSKGLDCDNTFKAIVQPWMDTIRDYLMLMTNKYGDRFELRHFDIEPGDSEFGQLYNTKVKCLWPVRTVAEHCEGKQVVGEYVIDAPKHFSAPVRRQTVACFKVGGSEMIMDEMIYSSGLKNTLAIFPNARVRRFRLDIMGSIGIHALVGYLKLMPALCKKMDELAARIDKMLEKQR